MCKRGDNCGKYFDRVVETNQRQGPSGRGLLKLLWFDYRLKYTICHHLDHEIKTMALIQVTMFFLIEWIWHERNILVENPYTTRFLNAGNNGIILCKGFTYSVIHLLYVQEGLCHSHKSNNWSNVNINCYIHICHVRTTWE